jgi:hypothetical protein
MVSLNPSDQPLATLADRAAVIDGLRHMLALQQRLAAVLRTVETIASYLTVSPEEAPQFERQLTVAQMAVFELAGDLARIRRNL